MFAINAIYRFLVFHESLSPQYYFDDLLKPISCISKKILKYTLLLFDPNDPKSNKCISIHTSCESSMKWLSTSKGMSTDHLKRLNGHWAWSKYTYIQHYSTLLRMHYADSRDQETRGLLVSLFGLYLLTKDVTTFLMNVAHHIWVFLYCLCLDDNVK